MSRTTLAIGSLAALLAILPLAARGSLAAGDPPVPEQAAAILGARCLSCHGADKKTAGIDLSTRAAAATAGLAGPDDPARNRLVRAMVLGKMPPAGKLPAAEIGVLREWVRAGMRYPREPLGPVKVSDQPLWSLEPV